MTRTMVHAGARFAPGVGFSLFQQAELQAALSAVLPPPLLSFQIPGCLEVLYRLFYSGSGEGELPGNGSQRRPADPLGVGPVTEVEVDRLGPVGQLLVLINGFQPTHAIASLVHSGPGGFFGMFLSSSAFICGDIIRLRIAIPLEDGVHQFHPSCILHLPGSVLRKRIGLPKGDAPLEKLLELGHHRVHPGLHSDEGALGHGFQLIGGHEPAAHHLHTAGVAVLAPAHRAGEDRLFPQIPGEGVRCFTAGGEAAEDGQLAVVPDDLGALFPVVLVQLDEPLDDGHNSEAPGPGGGEEHLRPLQFGDRPELIRKEDHAV